MSKTILETERLILCEFSTDDAPFILELTNDESYIRFIGDRGIKTLDDAKNYLLNVPMKSYEKFGFGLYQVKTKGSGTPVGTCGLIKRPELDDVDVGYAFLAKFRGKGYATEAGQAIVEYAKTVVGLKRVVAVALPDNYASVKVLEKLGLRFEKTIVWPDDNEECSLFSLGF